MLLSCVTPAFLQSGVIPDTILFLTYHACSQSLTAHGLPHFWLCFSGVMSFLYMLMSQLLKTQFAVSTPQLPSISLNPASHSLPSALQGSAPMKLRLINVFVSPLGL